jgi:predicted DNA-binding ribbon-helix-helix protein
VSGLKKRSISLSGHATSVALEPEFWAVLDQVALEMDLGQAGLMKRIDETRGRTPLASACRLLALAWAGGDRAFTGITTSGEAGQPAPEREAPEAG